MKKYIILIFICIFTYTELSIAKDKTKKYKNGDVFVGEIVKGLPEGQGTMTYTNGDVYVGQWVKGERDGQGTMTYSDKGLYKGQWKRDNMSDGTYTYPNGDIFVGKWIDGKINDGTLTVAKDNCVYKGYFHPYTGELEKGTITKDGNSLRLSGGTNNVLSMKNGTLLSGDIEFDGSSFNISKAQGTYIIDPYKEFNGEMRDGRFYDGEITVKPTDGDNKLIFKEHYNSGRINGNKWIVASELSIAKYASVEFGYGQGTNFPNGIESYEDTNIENRTYCKFIGTFKKAGETVVKHGHGKFEGWQWLTIEGDWENNVLVSGTGSYVQRQLTVATTNGKANLTVKSKYGTYNKTVSPDTCSVLDEAAKYLMDIFHQEDKVHYKEEIEALKKQLEKERQAQREQNKREGKKVFHKCSVCKGDGYLENPVMGTMNLDRCYKCGGNGGYWDY